MNKLYFYLLLLFISMSTITLTFAESIENHTGMEIIGKIAEKGFSKEDLLTIQSIIGGEIITLKHLDSEAYLLVVRKGVQNFDIDSGLLKSELEKLSWDKKAFMYGRVVNKKARHNLCFADYDSSADYEKKKGTVVNFTRIELLSKLRKKLQEVTLLSLLAEGNYYYDVNKTYIGLHGDTERKIVIGVRLGESFGLTFQWFRYNKSVTDPFTLTLDDGDIYFMSEKAVGFDWKKSSCFTLRHSAQKL